MVGFWPWSPLQLDLGARGDGDRGAGVGGADMADDVGVGKLGWGDEAVIQILWDLPASYDGFRIVKLEGWGVACVAGGVLD